MRRQPHLQELADRRLVVDHRILRGPALMLPTSRSMPAPAGGSLNARPAAVGAVFGRDGSVHGFDEAARDPQGQARSRPRTWSLFWARWNLCSGCRICARDRRREYLHPRPGSAARPSRSAGAETTMRMVVPSGVFRRVVQQVEEDLLEQDRVEVEQHRPWRPKRERQLDAMTRQDLAGAPQRAADDLSRRRRGARCWGAIAPDSSFIISSRLAMKRLSRSGRR